jgi:PTS system fructose-specific IIA component
VLANSLVLLKLREPVAWGSLDEAPVRVVILLVIRDLEGASEHMKVISTLARQVMHEDFRTQLEQASEPVEICRFLLNKIRD